MAFPANPDALLTRDQLSKALQEYGFPVPTPTLATKATRGGGPPYQKFGARVLYRWGDALAWAQSKLSAPRNSTRDNAMAARAKSEPSKVERVTTPTTRRRTSTPRKRSRPLKTAAKNPNGQSASKSVRSPATVTP